MHNSAASGQLQRTADSNTFICVAKVLCPCYGFTSIIMSVALYTGGCVPYDGSNNTSKGNLHCSPKQSWSAVCSQPRALSLQPLSEASQLVLPVLAQIVTLTSEMVVAASAVIARRISKQQKSYLRSKVENSSKPQRGTITWKFTFALLLAMFGVTFLSALVWRNWVCDYCSLPTAAQDRNV